jgi:choice-of-anchor A domain-containing protein
MAPGATLQMYLGGSDSNIGGNGISNDEGKAESLQIYGLPTATRISLSGNGKWTGIIYAPDSDFTFNGGGTRGLFIGALVANTVTVNGTHGMEFAYDEALKYKFTTYFRRAGWREEVVGTRP